MYIAVCACVLILIFRRGPLSIPTCVNSPADQMADNDFQIDTFHSTSRENQWALIAFFPRRSSPPEGYYLSPSLSVSICLSLFLSLHVSVSLPNPYSCTSQYHWDWINSCCFSRRIYCEKIQPSISLRRSSLCCFVDVTLPLLFVSVKVDTLSYKHWCFPDSGTQSYFCVWQKCYSMCFYSVPSTCYCSDQEHSMCFSCKWEKDRGWCELWPLSRFFPLYGERLKSPMGVSCVHVHTLLSEYLSFPVSSWGIESLNTLAKWP